jgi:hypothetical protein
MVNPKLQVQMTAPHPSPLPQGERDGGSDYTVHFQLIINPGQYLCQVNKRRHLFSRDETILGFSTIGFNGALNFPPIAFNAYNQLLFLFVESIK